MMFFIFLSDLLIDNNPFLYFFSQYVLTRITYFGALALFTCYCLLCKTKWYKTEFHYHSSKWKWNSRQKDACENHWREKIELLRSDSDPSHPSSSWPILGFLLQSQLTRAVRATPYCKSNGCRRAASWYLIWWWRLGSRTPPPWWTRLCRCRPFHSSGWPYWWWLTWCTRLWRWRLPSLIRLAIDSYR